MSKKTNTKAPPAKPIHPLVNEYVSACKANGFTDEAEIAAMSAYLEKYQGELRFVKKTITVALSKILIRLFQKASKLQRIVFHACYFQDPSFFTKLIADLNKHQVAQISFDYCPVQINTINLFVSAPSIEMLSLRGNTCLTSYNVPLFTESSYSPSLNKFYNFLSNSQLKMLDLTGCNLSDDGASSIARILYFNTSLRCLNLSQNRIGDDGAVELASALSFYFLTDQEVEIHERMMNEERKQRISDDGCDLVKKKKGSKAVSKKTIAKPKKGQPTKNVTDRTFSFDPKSQLMPIVISKWNSCASLEDGTLYIQGNTTLTSLILDDNLIGKSGYEKLKEMLSKNSKLINFSLADNPDISEEDAALILRKFENPPQEQ